MQTTAKHWEQQYEISESNKRNATNKESLIIEYKK